MTAAEMRKLWDAAIGHPWLSGEPPTVEFMAWAHSIGMRGALIIAAAELAESLPSFDETGKCVSCRRKRDPKKPMESHRSGCLFRAWQEASGRT